MTERGERVKKKKKPEEDLYRKREYFHPRKMAELAGLQPPTTKMYVPVNQDEQRHTDRVMVSFFHGLIAFGLVTIFTFIIHWIFLS
ncbi:hypothetical protein PFISCL1PPCAC_24249, partial [Pristionchus fissidentatus]